MAGLLSHVDAGGPPIAAEDLAALTRDKLYPGEDEYFRANPHVAGMAAEDDRVILNPYSKLAAHEKRAVAVNEAARILMRHEGAPDFALTPEQEAFLDGTEYRKAPAEERRATIAARILSGDPSAGAPTPEQGAFVAQIANRMRGGR